MSVRDGELRPEDFLGRLVSIDAEFAGDQVNSPEFVTARAAAVAAYDEMTAGTDRHHQLEQLAKALGIDF